MFYSYFVRQTGLYLIEIQSGRLKIGAKAYREWQAKLGTGGPLAVKPETPDRSEPVPIVIAVIGQAKAGKSSLVNALLKSDAALVDVLPKTQSVSRYALTERVTREQLVILDTPGYAETGATSQQRNDVRLAAHGADVVLVVLECRNPARQADVDVVASLADWYRNNPDEKSPPVLGVISKVDLLSPAREWSPPYHWERPTTAKEQSIAGAVAFHHELFGSAFEQAIPIAIVEGTAWNIDEQLWPAVCGLLPESRAVSLVRWLKRETDSGRAGQVAKQLMNIGRGLWDAYQASSKRVDR